MSCSSSAANPTINDDAELIDELTETSFSNAITSQNVNPDVTGSIHLKAKIALTLANSGVESYILNGNVEGRLTAALTGSGFVGTVTIV